MCKDCVRICPDRSDNEGCEDKLVYEDTDQFRAYDRMMRDNKGIQLS